MNASAATSGMWRAVPPGGSRDNRPRSTQVALGNRGLTPDAACSQVGLMNDAPPEGFKRNDFAACVRAVEPARAAADKVL